MRSGDKVPEEDRGCGQGQAMALCLHKRDANAGVQHDACMHACMHAQRWSLALPALLRGPLLPCGQLCETVSSAMMWPAPLQSPLLWQHIHCRSQVCAVGAQGRTINVKLRTISKHACMGGQLEPRMDCRRSKHARQACVSTYVRAWMSGGGQAWTAGTGHAIISIMLS